ncbi:MAG: anthrone oxygenase family protein [bacterium]
MSLTTVASLVAILGGAVIYGTDVFCALVLRPAATGAADASIADLIGRVHEYGDRRLQFPGVVSILATALASVTAPNNPARIIGAIAFLALLTWLAIYLRVSAPINAKLRAAAASGTVPADTRELQHRWDRVIWTRAALQGVALASLLAMLATRS